MTIKYNTSKKLLLTGAISSTNNTNRILHKAFNKSTACFLIGILLSALLAFLVVNVLGDKIEWSLIHAATIGWLIGSSIYVLIAYLTKH